MNKKFLLITAAALLLASAASAQGWKGHTAMTDDQVKAAIAQKPYRSAACHSPYYAPEEEEYSATPEGYKPFYVSHFGRHGSRFQTRTAPLFGIVCDALDSLHLAGRLTLEGDSLRLEIKQMCELNEKMEGMLTKRGTREHAGIAARMAKRFPEVFSQKDRNLVHAQSTNVQRTVQSMCGFTTSLVSCFPNVKLDISTGLFKDFAVNNPEDKLPGKAEIDKLVDPVRNALLPTKDELAPLAARLFKDYEPSAKLLRDIYIAAASAGCFDIPVNPVRFFTVDELFAFYRWRDASFNSSYGTLDVVREKQAVKGKMYLRMLIDDADRALDGGDRCADLRFCHDGNVGPLMNAFGVGPFAVTARSEAPYRDWQAFRGICMASNLQLVFFRSEEPGAEILVQTLYNERECDYPGLEPVSGWFYRWSDVRRYIASRCYDIREVPSFYKKHLEKKAKEIAELQKDEVAGFYFITDMHFPSNFGYAASLIESLEKTAENRLVIYGGDALTYLNTIDEGLHKQVSALEQIRGVSPILWARGNHDVNNYTGKKPWISAERVAINQWNTADLLSRFRPYGTVCNEKDPNTTYCYYDDTARNVRYIIFDTTDTIKDDSMLAGTSATQLRWMALSAILDAPKDCRIVAVSHCDVVERGGELEALLSAFSTHGKCTAGGVEVDFGARPDVNLTCLMCGHRHTDFSKTFPGGQSQINVKADCNYARPADALTISAQAFDYVSIAADGTVTTVRVGDGKNRKF